MSNVTYPFDPTGVAETNLVKDEEHLLTEVNASTYRILIPTFAPFYLRNLKLEFVQEDGVCVPMVEGSDFYCCLPYMAASRSTGQPVYGGLSILTTLANGRLVLQYQTVGGEWCADSDYVYARLLETVYNKRTTWWDTISNVQDTFPPTEHALVASDIDGMTLLLDKLEQIRASILNSSGQAPASWIQHLLAKGNVHGLTAADLNLGNVQNYEAATDEEVLAKEPLDKQ